MDEIKSVVENNESFRDEESDCIDFIEELLQYIHPWVTNNNKLYYFDYFSICSLLFLFCRLVNKTALSLAQSTYETRLANMHNFKRKMNAELQDNIISTYQDLKQYYKGIKEFHDTDCQLLLVKYLLKTTGTQLTNTCFTFMSDKNDDISSSEVDYWIGIHFFLTKQSLQIW